MSARWRVVPALAWLLACADEAPLHRVTFTVAAAGIDRDAHDPPVFTTPSGWRVTLASAQVSIGPVYFFDASPSAGTGANAGRVVAQVRAVFVVDALEPTALVVARGDGTDEPVHSASVALADDASGAVVHVAGIARRGDATVVFDGSLALPSSAGSAAYAGWLAHQVPQVPADFTAGDGGVLTVRVDATHWFDLVDFDALCANGVEEACDFSSRTATTQLAAGVGASPAFTFAWRPAP